jgi:NTE family protein
MKSFALALGGGGARGLGAIAVLEVLDEIGARPAALAGVSIGAAIGAAYAMGMSAKAIRRHAIEIAHRRRKTIARLMGARVAALSELFSAGLSNPMLLDAEKFAAAFLPAGLPDTFEELGIPLTVIAVDLYGRCEVPFKAGPLRPAVAASMAIPGVLQPVEHDGRILIDGAAVNPLPFDHLRGKAEVVIAVDNSIGPVEPRGIPGPWDALFSTLQVMSHTIVTAKLERGRPDLLLQQNLGLFRLFDFFQASSILRVAEQRKGEIREKIEAVLR